MDEILSRHVPRRADAPGVASAVLVPICRYPEGDRLLFTKRTETLGTHRGQVSFPGGKHSPEDPDLVATALREAHEEVGIRPEDVEILGRLDEIVTVTGFTILPVVGRLVAPYPFTPNPHEIDKLLEKPLAELLRPGAIRLERQEAPWGGRYNLYAFEAEGELVWGATARITQQLVSLLTGASEPLAPEAEGFPER